MKVNNIVKLLIGLVVILSIGLFITTSKLIPMKYENLGTPTIDNNTSNVTLDDTKSKDVIVSSPPLKEETSSPVDKSIKEDNHKEDIVLDSDTKENSKEEPLNIEEEKGDNPKNKKEVRKENKNKDKSKKNKDKKEEKPIVKSKVISKDQAIEIGLLKVGSGAKLIEVEPELDDNPPKYQLTIIKGKHKYEFEIHAMTGSILDYEKEETDD